MTHDVQEENKRKIMTVGLLIHELEAIEDKDAPIVLSVDAEGNRFKTIDGPYSGLIVVRKELETLKDYEIDYVDDTIEGSEYMVDWDYVDEDEPETWGGYEYDFSTQTIKPEYFEKFKKDNGYVPVYVIWPNS